MAGYNRVILMGNLTRDIDLRYTPSGTAVTDMRIAVSTPVGRGDNRREDTLFVDVTVWDRQAETCSRYLSKGRSVLVEGRLRLEEWNDRESGQKRSKISVTANNVQFIGGRGDGDGPSGGPPPRRDDRRPNDDRDDNRGDNRGDDAPPRRDEDLDGGFPQEDNDVPF